MMSRAIFVLPTVDAWHSFLPHLVRAVLSGCHRSAPRVTHDMSDPVDAAPASSNGASGVVGIAPISPAIAVAAPASSKHANGPLGMSSATIAKGRYGSSARGASARGEGARENPIERKEGKNAPPRWVVEAASSTSFAKAPRVGWMKAFANRKMRAASRARFGGDRT